MKEPEIEERTANAFRARSCNPYPGDGSFSSAPLASPAFPK
jgi:hypothetical protein